MHEPLYRYNPRKLRYERIESGPLKLFKSGAFQFVAGVALGVVLLLIGLKFYHSPTEIRLKKEKEQLSQKFREMENELKQMKNTLADIEKRDDELYRTILQKEPLSPHVRKAGVGGTERYQHLKSLDRKALVIGTRKKLDKVAKKLYIQSRSFDELMELARKNRDLLASVPAIRPVPGMELERIAAGFGMRLHPIHETREMHVGLDLVADIGTHVRATGQGVIKKVDHKQKGYGVNIIVDHGHGYKTRYAHLNEVTVQEGGKVDRGDTIGRIGNTGTSTGPHLHYEVIHNGKPVNPANYLFNDLSPNGYAKVLAASEKAKAPS